MGYGHNYYYAQELEIGSWKKIQQMKFLNFIKNIFKTKNVTFKGAKLLPPFSGYAELDNLNICEKCNSADLYLNANYPNFKYNGTLGYLGIFSYCNSCKYSNYKKIWPFEDKKD